MSGLSVMMSNGDLPAIISNISTPSAHQSTLNPAEAQGALSASTPRFSASLSHANQDWWPGSSTEITDMIYTIMDEFEFSQLRSQIYGTQRCLQAAKLQLKCFLIISFNKYFSGHVWLKRSLNECLEEKTTLYFRKKIKLYNKDSSFLIY